MPTDRQRRRHAKLVRKAAHEPRPAESSGRAPAHVVEAAREAFGSTLADAGRDEPRAAETAGRTQARRGRPRQEQFTVPEAAARLGVNRSTLYRRAAAGTLVLTRQPYTGQLVVSRDELERHAHGYRPTRGRPPILSDALLARIVAMRAQGISLPRIGAQLEGEGIPTAHGGARWWPSAVQAALRRAGAS